MSIVIGTPTTRPSVSFDHVEPYEVIFRKPLKDTDAESGKIDVILKYKLYNNDGGERDYESHAYEIRKADLQDMTNQKVVDFLVALDQLSGKLIEIEGTHGTVVVS